MINIHETFKTIFDEFLDNYIKKFLNSNMYRQHKIMTNIDFTIKNYQKSNLLLHF